MRLFDSGIFDVTGELSFATAYGQLSHPSVRSVCAVGGVVVGIVLAESWGNRRSCITGHHNGADNDIPGTGGTHRSAQGALSDRIGFLRLSLIRIHICNDNSGASTILPWFSIRKTLTFCLLFQFAIVHYFTKYGSGECYFSREDFESDEDSDLDANSKPLIGGRGQRNSSNTLPRANIEREIFEVIPLSMCSIPMRSTAVTATTGKAPRRSNSTWLDWPCRRQRKASIHAIPIQTTHDHIYSHAYVKNNTEDECSDSELARNGIRRESNRSASKIAVAHDRRSRTKRMPRFNSVSKIDRASRIFFPLVFLLINVFYWYSYLSKSERWVTPQASLRGQ